MVHIIDIDQLVHTFNAFTLMSCNKCYQWWCHQCNQGTKYIFHFQNSLHVLLCYFLVEKKTGSMKSTLLIILKSGVVAVAFYNDLQRTSLSCIIGTYTLWNLLPTLARPFPQLLESPVLLCVYEPEYTWDLGLLDLLRLAFFT